MSVILLLRGITLAVRWRQLSPAEKAARFSSWSRKYEESCWGLYQERTHVERNCRKLRYPIKKSTLLDYLKRSKPSREEASTNANEEHQSLSINFPMKAKHNRQVFDVGHERKLADCFRISSAMNHGLPTKRIQISRILTLVQITFLCQRVRQKMDQRQSTGFSHFLSGIQTFQSGSRNPQVRKEPSASTNL